MTKKATAKTIPREILDLVRKEFNASEFSTMSRGTGKWSFIPYLQKCLYKFLEDHTEELPTLIVQYPKGPTEDLLRRAFNLKSPPGATKSLRDLLCLFATQSKLDWNTVISTHYSDKYSSLLDQEKQELIPEQSPSPSIDNFANKIAELLLEKLSSKEIEIVKKQMLDEKVDRVNHDELIDNILVPSQNDPNNPEFPPKPFFTPKFPASSTYQIQLPGFKNVWLKDESTNPGGTHKARMAWEVVIKAVRYQIKEISLISSGSAATAIQHFFNLYGVNTTLKVLVDHRMKPEIKKHLIDLGCKLYETDLSEKPLTGKEIKELTDNTTGIDITYREVLDRYNDNYYDWLSYEIINENPEYCFIPFGTGDLFINILIIAEREFNNRIFKHDPRFTGDIDIVSKCNFIGATTHSESTRLDKLFSYHLPSLKDYNDYLESLIANNRIGQASGILELEEEYIEEALDIAKHQNIKCEPSGIAGLALLLQNKNDIPHHAKILIVNTGCTDYSLSSKHK
ncbi:MAG: PLP-dependent lyase/thiolase [Bacteroidia bacterium]|nr:PLP-dependent lyase/thiolase [Bacteroidia bacterium]